MISDRTVIIVLLVVLKLPMFCSKLTMSSTLSSSLTSTVSSLSGHSNGIDSFKTMSSTLSSPTRPLSNMTSNLTRIPQPIFDPPTPTSTSSSPIAQLLPSTSVLAEILTSPTALRFDPLLNIPLSIPSSSSTPAPYLGGYLNLTLITDRPIRFTILRDDYYDYQFIYEQTSHSFRINLSNDTELNLTFEIMWEDYRTEKRGHSLVNIQLTLERNAKAMEVQGHKFYFYWEYHCGAVDSLCERLKMEERKPRDDPEEMKTLKKEKVTKAPRREKVSKKGSKMISNGLESQDSYFLLLIALFFFILFAFFISCHCIGFKVKEENDTEHVGAHGNNLQQYIYLELDEKVNDGRRVKPPIDSVIIGEMAKMESQRESSLDL